MKILYAGLLYKDGNIDNTFMTVLKYRAGTKRQIAWISQNDEANASFVLHGIVRHGSSQLEFIFLFSFGTPSLEVPVN